MYSSISACSSAAATALLRPARPFVGAIARATAIAAPQRSKATSAKEAKSKSSSSAAAAAAEPQDNPAFTHALTLLAQANALPAHKQLATIRAFRSGQADFALPEYRSLGLTHFFKHRRPRLMQFAEQRHVFSDFFPKHEDQINVEVHLAARGKGKEGEEATLVRIELGKEVAPAQMIEPLQVYIQPYHEEVKKYTFVLVDGDMARPDWEVRSEQVLWMVKDIPLSASTATAPLPLPTTSGDDKSVGTLILPYVPPHPTQGTGAHRILAFVFEQPASPATDIPTTLPRGISLWELIQAHKLTPRGIHIWKSQWDPSVSHVFTNVLNVKEPVFVTRPKIGRKGVDGLIENRYEGI